MNAYIPAWFAFKKKSNFTDGSKRFFRILRSTQKLSDKTRNVVNKVLQRNAFCAHPEHILIAMIHEPEQCARVLGWRRIFKARVSPSHSTRQRIFKIPKLRFNFERYFEMIDWQNAAVPNHQ